MEAVQSVVGIAVLLAIAWALSERRRDAPWRLVAVGVAIQGALALLLLKVPGSRLVFEVINDGVMALQAATRAGTSFVFGYLGGGTLPFEEPYPGAAFILAFQALPLVLVISALTALLTYWQILPWIVRLAARLLSRVMGIGGAVGLSAAANIFVGMVEAPLFIRPYMNRLSRSEMFTVMTVGMATIAGTVLVIYAGFLGPVLPGAAGHLLVASIISAPAAILIAQVMVPETGPQTDGTFTDYPEAAGTMDAITQGTQDGLKLWLNVIAMLLVLIALVTLVNQMLSLLPAIGGEPVTLERLLGLAMAPLVWLIGIPWSEAVTAGGLMGVKTVLNEFLAFQRLGSLPEGTLSERSVLIMSYALCGFANFGSLGIMIGGLAALAPDRRGEIAALGPRSIVSGTLATLMTGAVVGVIS